MDIKVIAAVFLALVVIFIIGQLWFHLIEGILEIIKRPFRRKQTWHPLPEEKEEKIIDKR